MGFIITLLIIAAIVVSYHKDVKLYLNTMEERKKYNNGYRWNMIVKIATLENEYLQEHTTEAKAISQRDIITKHGGIVVVNREKKRFEPNQVERTRIEKYNIYDEDTYSVKEKLMARVDSLDDENVVKLIEAIFDKRNLDWNEMARIIHKKDN